MLLVSAGRTVSDVNIAANLERHFLASFVVHDTGLLFDDGANFGARTACRARKNSASHQCRSRAFPNYDSSQSANDIFRPIFGLHDASSQDFERVFGQYQGRQIDLGFWFSDFLQRGLICPASFVSGRAEN